jgi:hypothetical protein
MTNRRDLLAAAALLGPLALVMRSVQATDGEPQEPKATSNLDDKTLDDAVVDLRDPVLAGNYLSHQFQLLSRSQSL